MTRYIEGDQEKTLELIRQSGDDSSWLRHRGLAAELDRRLLRGATEFELNEVRGTWRGHIDHLRRIHNVLTEKDSNGVWRIVDVARGPAVTSVPPHEKPGDDDEDPEVEQHEELLGVDHQALDRIALTAQALAALAEVGLLHSVLLKASVGMLIRQASESNHWHNCAHYRSLEARRLIESAAIRSGASYQSFCTRNLRHEHVVPNSVLYRMLCQMNDRSAPAIEALLTKYCIRATVTREEDIVLSQNRLSSKMPDEFFEKGHPLYMDPLARYKFVGLFTSLEARNTPRWFMD